MGQRVAHCFSADERDAVPDVCIISSAAVSALVHIAHAVTSNSASGRARCPFLSATTSVSYKEGEKKCVAIL